MRQQIRTALYSKTRLNLAEVKEETLHHGPAKDDCSIIG